MANQHQFEQWAEDGEDGTETCAVCEAMLPEAAEGGLSEAEQKAFDRHVAGCMQCARELAEARRGAAWLAMLKSEAPEPPAGLLERILAGTTGGSEALESEAVAGTNPVAAPSRPAVPDSPAVWDHVAPENRFPEIPLGAWGGDDPRPVAPAWALSSVWRKAAGAFRIESARATFQPRLAMTAAMAFFSIALTLNLTGVRLRDMRAQSFTTSGLRRSVADASASATRSFQNMRVVYQVESRVSELRTDDQPTGGQGSRGPQR